MTDIDSMSLNLAIKPFVNAVLARKAIQVVILDVRNLTSYADVFIICSGRSNRQVTAIADFVQRDLKKKGKKPINVEGKKEGHWVLMDYGDVIIHIFYESSRDFYDLESLWIDAKPLSAEQLMEE
ncbi:MAG: ribosome silencing factor [Desulfobacterales bacterium]|jgi:ribosome-associated protein|nr:ribosome silencing factor [Desulfobacterales bacterium]MDX2512578.1 ribosome silencing factor [Desulfobacterales bacterium]